MISSNLRQLQLSDGVGINVPLEASIGFGVRLDIATARILDRLNLLFSLTSGFYQIDKGFDFFLRRRKSISPWQLAKISQRLQPITARIFVVSPCDPSPRALANRRSVAQETTRSNALPMRLTSPWKRFPFLHLAQVQRHGGSP